MSAYKIKNRNLSDAFIAAIANHMNDAVYGQALRDFRTALDNKGTMLFLACMGEDLLEFHRQLPARLRAAQTAIHDTFFIHGVDRLIEKLPTCSGAIQIRMPAIPSFVVAGSYGKLSFRCPHMHSDCALNSIPLNEATLPIITTLLQEYMEILDKQKATKTLSTEFDTALISTLDSYKRLHPLLEAWPEMEDIIKQTSFAHWVTSVVPNIPEIQNIKELTQKFKEGASGSN